MGKTNVGKSSLFNRLSNMRLSIAHSTPGATRDLIMRDAQFLGNLVSVVDSGGIEDSDVHGNPFQGLVSKHVFDFVRDKASLILFVVSAKDGITGGDLEIASYLRKLGRPVLMVINKVDHDNNEASALDCQRFGFSEPVLVSAAQCRGLHELRARVLHELGLKPIGGQVGPEVLTLVDDDMMNDDDTDRKVNISVIGKPNSGKSTFVNALLNEERVLVSEMAGTTVDAVDTDFEYRGQEICLVDTAGIRRQRSINEEVEKMAVARSLCAIDRAHVTILMINGAEGVSEQDQKIAGMIFEKKKPCIIAVNKWDEEVRSKGSEKKFLEEIRFTLPFIGYAPVKFLSAKYGQRIFDVVDAALKLAPKYSTKINTSRLNRSLEKAQAQHPPPIFMGRRLKMYFATQVDTSPPTFVISCSKPDGFHFSYKRYLTNFFRNDLALGEIPLRLIFRKKSDNEPYRRDL